MPNTSIQTSASSIHMKNWLQDMVRGCLATALLFYFEWHFWGREWGREELEKKFDSRGLLWSRFLCFYRTLILLSVDVGPPGTAPCGSVCASRMALLSLCVWLKLCSSFFHPDKPASLRDTNKLSLFWCWSHEEVLWYLAPERSAFSLEYVPG